MECSARAPKLNTQYKTPARARWNLSKADWALFRKEFSSVEDITSNIDVSVLAYNTFEQHIIISASKAIPLKEDHLFLGGTKPVKICVRLL